MLKLIKTRTKIKKDNMDQKQRISLYIKQIGMLHAADASLAPLCVANFDEYEKIMAAKMPRFKEDYKTLFKMAIREWNTKDFQRQLAHYLNITQTVLNGTRTLDDATKQVASEQYDKYVAPVLKPSNSTWNPTLRYHQFKHMPNIKQLIQYQQIIKLIIQQKN